MPSFLDLLCNQEMPPRRKYARTTARRKFRRRGSYAKTPYRRRSTTSYRRKMGPVPSSPGRKLTAYSLAQIDPFEDRVIGVKIPDANTVPSAPLCCLNELTITTSASGLACSAFLAHPSIEQVVGIGSSGATWSFPITWTDASNVADPKIASIRTNYTALRPVAHGIRLMSPLAPTTATGYVHIAIQPIDSFGANGFNGCNGIPKSLSDLSGLGWYRRFPLAAFTQKTMTVVNKFLDDTSQRYTSAQLTQAGYGQVSGTTQTNNATFQLGLDWCAIFIAVDSAPNSTNVLTAEYVLHMEGIPSPSGVISATPSSPSDPQELDNTAYAAANVPASHWETENASIGQRFTQAMNEAAQSTGSSFRQAGQWVWDNRRTISRVARHVHEGYRLVNGDNDLSNNALLGNTR